MVNLHKLVSKEFLPLPRKSHYLFNLRDMIRITEGLCKADPVFYSELPDPRRKLLLLWVHENVCEYSDRLSEKSDRVKFFYSMNNVLLEEFHLRFKEVVEEEAKDGPKDEEDMTALTVLFGNFNNPDRKYVELGSREDLNGLVHGFIGRYNECHQEGISIVLFDEILSLLTKVNRVLSKPYGNLLISSMGGVGVRTITRLSAFMQDLVLFEPVHEKEEAYEWAEYLKKLLRAVGHKQEGSVLLLSGELSNRNL